MAARPPGGSDPELPRCGAKTQVGGNCIRFPVRGAKRCYRHGGGSPQAQKAAKRAVLAGKALIQLSRMDTSRPVTDPLTALSEVAGEIIRWKDLMALHVADLQNVSYSSAEAGEQIRGQVLLYERAMDRAVQVLAAIAKLNIDERLAAIDERQAALVERAVVATLDSLSLTVEQRRDAMRTLTRHLRVVAA